jgi:hypothetical protein
LSKKINKPLLQAVRGIIEAHDRLQLIPIEQIADQLNELGYEYNYMGDEFQDVINYLIKNDPNIGETRCLYFNY